MKLIDLLVQELPKRGGWPEGVERLEQYTDGSLFDGSNYQSDFKCPRVDDFGDDEVTRDQYEAALAASQKVEWDGNYPIKPGTDVDVHFDGDDCLVWTTFRVEYMRGDVVVLHDYRTDDVGAYSNRILNFRPIRSEADKKREIGVTALALAMGDPPFIYGQRMNDGRLVAYGVYELYDKIAAGEVAGIRIE